MLLKTKNILLIGQMWPFSGKIRYPDNYPIDHVSDIIKCILSNRPTLSEISEELANVLHQEWQRFPRAKLQKMIVSLPSRSGSIVWWTHLLLMLNTYTLYWIYKTL